MKYSPVKPTHIVINSHDGKVWFHTVSAYWLKTFINDQINAKKVSVAYDEYNEEYAGNDFIVLAKGNTAIALFDYEGKSYILSKHILKKKQLEYAKIFYSTSFGKKQLTLRQIEKKFGSAKITLLYQETLTATVTEL